MNAEVFKINDCEIFYEVIGEGEPLLLLHGFTGSGEDLKQTFGDYSQKYKLIIPDLRGHGRSTNPSKVYTHRQAARDIEGLLSYLGITSCRALGASAGGSILLHVATTKHVDITEMILISAAQYYPAQARKIMNMFTIESRTESDWEQARKIHKHGDDQIRMLWAQARAFKDSYFDLNFTPDLLGTITAKTLIVFGDSDPLYPVQMAVDMNNAIPDSNLWIVPEGGHVPVGKAELPQLMSFFSH